MGAAHPKELREKVRDLWISGKATTSTISRQFGIPRNRIHQWRAEEDWDGARNLADQEANQRLVGDLADQLETAKRNDIKIYALMQHFVWKRMSEFHDAGLVPPTMELLLLARVVREYREGRDALVGRDPKLEAKHQIDVAPRRVIIDYDPLAEALQSELEVEAETEEAET